ncbi:MAG: hypothetical protein IJ642_01795 [Oscillospiraceae bacterium]|nr:hypothetical protein [Oscillospiraceae bacterium]
MQYDITKDAGEYTESIFGNLFSDEFDAEKILTVLQTGIGFRNFGDGLTETILSAGYTGDAASVSDKTSWLLQAVKTSGGNFSRATVTDWFSGKRRPKCNAEGRKNMFLVCISLHLNLEQTVKFFTKVFFDQPFNFRSPEECIIFYCLRKSLSWLEVQRIQERFRQKQKTASPVIPAEHLTAVVRNRLPNLETEEALLEYLLLNLPEQTANYQTARNYLVQLCEEASALALEESRIAENTREGFTKYRHKNSIDFLLFMIYDIPATEKLFQGKAGTVPDIVRKNFPRKMEFSKALSGQEDVTSDIMRKCLILLMFYITYVGMMLEEVSDSDGFDRFINETDVLLDECGLPLLYPANPFDWIFLSCAADGESTECLDNFRNFISQIQEEEE